MLDKPWESCITMGDQWSYKPDDNYKSARDLIHLLIGVVARGGNLLFNVGPQPDGRFPEVALSRLGEIGDCRDKFASASGMQALAGSCPVTVQSNKRRYVAFRAGCCKPFRNAVQQFARLSATGPKGAPWAKGYLSEQLARGHSVSRATRALGNRWLAIIFRLWQDRVEYDEKVHLRNRARRGHRVAA